MQPEEISYSQLDITESLGDNLRLTPEDWIATIPLNKLTPDGRGLPPVDASDETVYEFALRLSQLRESIPIPNDGVYKVTNTLSAVRESITEVWMGLR